MPNFKLRYWQWILLVVFFIFFTNLDAIYINLMETRNMVTAREMVHLHHWVMTTLDNIPRYEKPPLPTWITALFGMLFGFKSFVVMRLPAALMSLLTVWMLYKFTPLLKVSQKQAFLTALILASSFYLIFSGRTNQWDVYTHAFMMVSIYYLWKFFKKDDQLYRNAILSALFFGFSFMSKGPVSLYALWLPFLISFGVVYKFKKLQIRWKPLILFLLIGFGIGLWWFIYVRLVDPGTFEKIMTRESSRWGNYNVRPFYYYWSFFIQSGIWTIPAFVSLLYPYLKNRVSNKKAYLFSLLWTLFSVILLSIIPEKKSRYLLPALIPLALTTGFYIEYLFRKFKSISLKESGIVYFNHGLIAVIGFVFPVVGYFILDLETNYWIWYIISSITLLSLGIAMIYFLRHKNYPKIFYLTITFICATMTFVFPLNTALIANPKANNIGKLRKLSEKKGFPVYEYGNFAPQMIWEFGKPIPQIDQDNPVWPDDKKFGLILHEKDTSVIEQLKSHYRIVLKKRYDLNYVNPKKSGYKDWLVRKFYLFEEI